MFFLSVLVVIVTSCATRTPQPATTTTARTYQLSDSFAGGAGCTPKGEELTLEGTIVVRPFGKGTDGAELETATERWILSYRAEGPLLELRDRRVRATGRECDKQGEAIYGRHFDARTVVAIP